MSATAAVQKFCDAIGVEIVPTTVTPGARQTTAPNIIRRLLDKYGEGHVSLVLKAIVDSEGNDNELRADVILAVSDLLANHNRWSELGLALLEAMDSVDLGEVRRQAKASAVRPLRSAVELLLFSRLQDLLGPPVLPRLRKPLQAPEPCYIEARAAQVQRRVSIGVELLALKPIAPRRQFGRMAHDRFGLDPLVLPEYLNVARVYRDRPEITRALTWHALTELASPSLPVSIRLDFEAMLEAGKRVTAPDIARARKAHPQARTPAENIELQRECRSIAA